jgi:outer membrane protein
MSTKHGAAKVIRPIILWLVAALCGSPPVFGQAASPAAAPTHRLTLRDCTRLALTQSPLLKAAAQDRIAARETVGEAQGSYYPTVGVRGNASRWQTHAFLPTGLSNPSLSSTIGPTDDWSGGGFARYLLYDGGIRRAGLESARIQESAAAQDAETTRLNLIFEVHQVFHQLAVATELQTVANHGLVNAESHHHAAKSRHAAGETTEADVLRTQVEVDNARAELIRTESLIRTAKGDLNTVMGWSAERPIEIDASGAELPPGAELNIATHLEQAVLKRPEIQAAQSAVAAARHQVQAARAAFGPRIYADGNYGWRDDSAAFRDEAWSAGISIELTAFEGFSKQHALTRTRTGEARAQAALERVNLAIRQEVWAACSRFQEARELVRATATQVRDAGESLRLMSARYKAGAVTVTDLLDAQTAFTAAEARHVQSRWSCRHSQSALSRATGTLTGEE